MCYKTDKISKNNFETKQLWKKTTLKKKTTFWKKILKKNRHCKEMWQLEFEASTTCMMHARSYGVIFPPKFKFHIRNIIVCIRNIIVGIRNMIVHIRNIIACIRSIIVRIRNIILRIRNIIVCIRCIIVGIRNIIFRIRNINIRFLFEH